MKINAFQIKNYRSIVDSRKCYLSPDYITALIGQNESGKTSVLEALRSFYEGTITDDVLRSDLTFPEITCTFTLDSNKKLNDYIDLAIIPQELHTMITSRTEVAVTRKWLNSRQSIIIVAEAEISDYYNGLEYSRLDSSNRIIASIPDLIKQTEVAARELDASENAVTIARNELNATHNRVEELKRTITRAKSPDIQITAQQDLEHNSQQLSDFGEKLKDKLAWLEERKSLMQLLSDKLSACKAFHEVSLRIQAVTGEIKSYSKRIHETEYQVKLSKSDRESKNFGKRLDQLHEKQSQLSGELRLHQGLQSKSRKIADKILTGKTLTEAEHEAVLEYELENSYATQEEIGMAIFKHIPMFEFFEDFSSLLPNKIDLDDLLNENIHAEGYKAARNFLFVAGLNADFFREDNHRILKQKIENLNSEITIDFQDYWRQSVGKDDKIRINFELEHYDNSQPDKSGKPYLEFWVKDKLERLYPKQRSRGVRWFLSFYLELKATAKKNTVDRVMLIDEPGLSLHARAQEDVLKVFEDLRESLQIIYCTHSPNLIDLKKLYRIIAIQRAKETDEKSETIVHDARSLNEASADTLSPIYALMGTRLNDKQFIFPKNNFIVEDAVTFHYMDVMARLYGIADPLHFIPASGTENIPIMANIFFGWKIDFGVVLLDKPENNEIVKLLKETTLFANNDIPNRRFILMQDIGSIEDLFSTIDFKRFILNQRVGITVSNSEYIEINKMSRMILVSDFRSKLSSEDVQFKDFDTETKGNFEKLFAMILHKKGQE